MADDGDQRALTQKARQKAERERRLSDALRRNLRRRKAETRSPATPADSVEPPESKVED